MTALDLDAASALGAATLHEAAGRIGALRSDIHAVDPSMRLAGPAFTVTTPPGDNLWIHRAVYAARPGDVLIVATGDAGPRWGYWGEILSVAALERGLGGLVLEGGSRDHDQLRSLGFPVFSLGACIRGTVKDLSDQRRLNAPIEIYGLAISPGDLVVGDADGVVVLPGGQAAHAVAAGQQREDKERTIMTQIRSGATTLDLLGLGPIE